MRVAYSTRSSASASERGRKAADEDKEEEAAGKEAADEKGTAAGEVTAPGSCWPARRRGR